MHAHGGDYHALLRAQDRAQRQRRLIVIADMPGVGEKSVDIQVDHNVLTIAGRVGSENFDARKMAGLRVAKVRVKPG